MMLVIILKRSPTLPRTWGNLLRFSGYELAGGLLAALLFQVTHPKVSRYPLSLSSAVLSL